MCGRATVVNPAGITEKLYEYVLANTLRETEVQRELNSRVVLDKKTPKEVASEYLKEAGFTK